VATRLLLASVALTILLVSRPSTVLSQTSSAVIELPSPSGKYAVGRIAYHWEDNSRMEQFSKVAQAHRELMVYVWYPVDARDKHSKHAEYLPGVAVIAGNKEGQEMRDYWGDAWEQLRLNKVAAETLDAPPVASGEERFPPVTFSPGLGVPVTAYTGLIQEVVSHGYIVVSIEPTYETPAVVFPDGHLVASVPEATGRHLPTPPGETREQFNSSLNGCTHLTSLTPTAGPPI
jgi:Platelet-activating factor acetylhydrolase, isoform II